MPDPEMVLLSFLIPAADVARARLIARKYWGIPPEAVITRETYGFGDFIEYPLGPSEGAEPTHYFCCDHYRTGTGYTTASDFVAWLAQQGPEEWLHPIEGDPRPTLAAMGLVLTERLPEYPAEILGIDR